MRVTPGSGMTHRMHEPMKIAMDMEAKRQLFTRRSILVKNDDKRVRRTKKAIREALLKLIQDKPISRVSTSELCREADINRNTFYAHYSTPEDVLSEIEDEFLGDLSTLLEDTYEAGEVTLAMCRAIDSKREHWHAIWKGDPHLIERAIDMCCEMALSRWGMDGSVNMGDGALFLRFITRGASGVVGGWLEDGCRMPPEQMSALIDRFVRDGQRTISI